MSAVSTDSLFYNSTHIILSEKVKIGLTTLDTLLMVTVLIHASFPLTACWRSKDFQRSHVKFVFSLSVATYLMALFLPYHAVAYWTDELGLSNNKYFCLGQVFVFYLAFFALLCSLFFLAIDRCLVLRFPLNVKLMSNRVSDVCTVLLWLYSLVVAVLPLVWLNVWDSAVLSTVMTVTCFHHFVLMPAYVYVVIVHLLVFLVFVLVVTIQMDYFSHHNLQAVRQLYLGDLDADKYIKYLKQTGMMAGILLVLFLLSYFPYLFVLAMQVGQMDMPHLPLLHVIFFYLTFVFVIIAPLVIMLLDQFLRHSAENLLLGLNSKHNTPAANNNALIRDPKEYTNAFAKKVVDISQLNPNQSPHPVALGGIFW